MSRVYFHSPSGTAELRGSERAYASWLCNSIGIAALDDVERLTSHIDAGYQLRNKDDALVVLRIACADFVLPSGRYNSWEVMLNTCLAIGNDPLCLMARMHGQCELHAWVAGEDRAWLANVIEQGRASGLMRNKQGWEDVVEHLRSCDDEPVVMSYSVCEQFPGPHVAGEWTRPVDDHGDPDDQTWFDLPSEMQWEYAMAGIKEMRFGPDSLRRPFGHEKTAFDVLRETGR